MRLAIHEQAHIMLLKTIDKNRDIFASNIIEAPTNQFKALICEIEHRRREIDFTCKPGFNGMLVTGFNIYEGRGNKRSNVIRRYFCQLGCLGWQQSFNSRE